MRFATLLLIALAAAAHAAEPARPQPLRGGIEFQGADIQAMQRDAFGNPGSLWIERGERLWGEPRGAAGASCASCHGKAAESMKGVAARYPRHDAGVGRVVNLETRINTCVQQRQKAPALAWESEPLLALNALVSAQSNGTKVDVAVDGPSAAAYERGRTLYFERQGQLNIACTHCHDGSWGRTLLNERISQGHPVDWPAYRLEWQSLGSLQRRLRACYFGVRAQMPAFGSDELVALELYLAARAGGLTASVPGVRR